MTVDLRIFAEGCRDGSLPVEEAQACAAAQRDAAAQQEMAFIGAIAVAAMPLNDVALLRSLRTRITPRGDAEKHLPRLRKRISRRRRQGPSRPAGFLYWGCAAAAAALVLIVLTLRSAPSGAVPPKAGQTARKESAEPTRTEPLPILMPISLPISPPISLRLDGEPCLADQREIRSEDRIRQLTGPGWQLDLQPHSVLQLPEHSFVSNASDEKKSPAHDVLLTSGGCRISADVNSQAPQVRVDHAQFQLNPASCMAIQYTNGSLLALVEAGAVNITVGSAAAYILKIHESVLLQGDQQHRFDDRQVIFQVDSADPASLHGLPDPYVVDGVLHSKPDPLVEVDAAAIDIMTLDQGPLLQLRGDEQIEVIYRWTGPIRWSGMYLNCMESAELAVDWPENPQDTDWQTRTLSVRSFMTVGTGPHVPVSGQQLRQLRLQVGPEATCGVLLKRLRIIRPWVYDFAL